MITAPERVKFSGRSAFARDLDASVASYFTTSGRSRRDVARMYLKTAVILTWFVGSWALLVFVAANAWHAVLAAISLGLSIAAVGMSVQHDANHGAYSKHEWVNRGLGAMLDVMGASSAIWRPKHNVGHHTFTNVEGVDYDLDFGWLARLSVEQKHLRYQRYQHLYLWFFYGLLLPKWVFHDDWLILKTRFIGVHRLPPLGRWGLARFIAWKLFFVSWSIVVPAFFHPLWQVALFHLLAACVLGWTLGTIFQLAHCTDEASFPRANDDGRLSTDWAEHQLATTVDFAAGNPAVTWFAGGLNFQVEHHLFPKVCHLHYPALARIVTEVAARHGLRHRRQSTFRGALGAHFRHLRALGLAPVEGTALRAAAVQSA